MNFDLLDTANGWFSYSNCNLILRFYHKFTDVFTKWLLKVAIHGFMFDKSLMVTMFIAESLGFLSSTGR